MTSSERRKLREQMAATQITEFMTELSDENFKKAVTYATTDDKLKHFFENADHKFDGLLLLKKWKKAKVVEAVIWACVGKIPADGTFGIWNDLPINVHGYMVCVRGSVIDGIPKLGTIFIK